MKNKKMLQRVSVVLVTLLALAVFQFVGSGCSDDTQRYSTQEKTNNVPGGGVILSHVDRQTYGNISGNQRSIDYYVYADYSGSETVKEIRTTWVQRAQFWRKSGSSYSAGVTMGTSSVGLNVSSGSTTQYVDSATITKYWSNTNGATHAYYDSNYIVWPRDQLRSDQLSNTARLNIYGHANPIEAVAAVSVTYQSVAP
jgi:hypothetical protein